MDSNYDPQSNPHTPHKLSLKYTAPILEVKHPLLERILTDKGGEGFREDSFWHAYSITASLKTQFQLENPSMIAFPRGGVATGVGARRAFKNEPFKFKMLPFSQKGLEKERPLPELAEHTDLILIDGVIATGSTLLSYLENVEKHYPNWQGRLFIVSNMAAEVGINNIKKKTKTLGLELSCLATGYVVPPDECAWKKIANKRIYFVGVSKNIGDFGDMMSEGLSPEQLSHWESAVE